jgi:hypothetical protein
MDQQFKPRADSGNLFSSQSKRSEKSPDYFGEVVINPKDMTNVRTEDGLHIFKINGWKRTAKSGKTYLSLAVDRFVPDNKGVAPQTHTIPDEDIPF